MARHSLFLVEWSKYITNNKIRRRMAVPAFGFGMLRGQAFRGEAMGTAIKHQGTLRATLCEIERGVFYASYPDCPFASDTDELTSYQTGLSAADAKLRIELTARALGYDAVVWTESIIAPLFASRTRTARPEPAPTPVARFGSMHRAG